MARVGNGADGAEPEEVSVSGGYLQTPRAADRSKPSRMRYLGNS